MITGSCHCDNVSYTYPGTPDFAVSCNCSICRRLGTKWIYERADKVEIKATEGAFQTYIWGDRDIAFHTCKTCGTTTHFTSIVDPAHGRVALNLNMAELDVIESIPVRHFDGADSWEFVD